MKQALPEVRKRGRPSGAQSELLSDLVIESALHSFRSYGFEATSVEAVALACKVSKHTIYRRFPTKDALFIAAVDRDRKAILARMNGIDNAGKHTMHALRQSCFELFEIAVCPGSTDLYRMCISAIPKFPMIGQQFAESESRIQQILRPLVEKAQTEGLLAIGDSNRLSTQLYYVTVGEIWMHALLGLSDVSDPEARAALFEANWAMFLDGHRRR